MKDIKSIPFEEIEPAVEELIEERHDALLAGIKSKVTASNKRAISRVIRESARYKNYEEGSDGDEEEAVESLPGLPDVDKVEVSEEAYDEIIAEAKVDVATAFVQRYNLGSNYNWMLPQMMAHFGTWKAIKNSKGKYCGQDTLHYNTKDSAFDFGLHLISMLQRGVLIKCPLNSKTQKHYLLNTINHLVPLVLGGFKIYQKIPYSAWEKRDIQYIVDPELYWGMVSEVPKDMPAEAILSLRTLGLSNRGEKTSGKTPFKSPVSQSRLAHLDEWDNSEYDLTRTNYLGLGMLAQIWCAHPDNRNPEYQVLDPLDWDNVPAPLVEASISKPIKKYPTTMATAPWERFNVTR